MLLMRISSGKGNLRFFNFAVFAKNYILTYHLMAASDAGSDNNSGFNEPGNLPESFIVTIPAPPVQEPVTSATATNQPVIEMPMEEFRTLIRVEICLQQTLHHPS